MGCFCGEPDFLSSAAPFLYPNTTVTGNAVNYAIAGGFQLILVGTSTEDRG